MNLQAKAVKKWIIPTILLLTLQGPAANTLANAALKRLSIGTLLSTRPLTKEWKKHLKILLTIRWCSLRNNKPVGINKVQLRLRLINQFWRAVRCMPTWVTIRVFKTLMLDDLIQVRKEKTTILKLLLSTAKWLILTSPTCLPQSRVLISEMIRVQQAFMLYRIVKLVK